MELVGENTTENGAVSNPSTGSARINFYFKGVRSLAHDPESLHQYLAASWEEDALDTLKIIFHTRDCRGGKGEKRLFAECVLWLATHYPETLRKNIKHIPYFGKWKDLLMLLPTPLADEALRLFADQLKKDLEKVNEAKAKAENNASTDNSNAANNANQTEKADDPQPSTEKPIIQKERANLPFISLAAKWAPSENQGCDTRTNCALKLALLLSPNPKTALRDYRKQYLSPLRAHLRIIERHMCAKEWDKIPYNLVPSRCMDINSKRFKEHDKGRFQAYLDAVKADQIDIKGKQMFPHELVMKFYRRNTPNEVAELQWKVLVKQAHKYGTLSSSLVLSDVSGSMNGIPMMVSIALGLLISEITAPPFTNCVITFHEKPSFHTVVGDSLQQRVQDLKKAEWGGNTNFQAVFELILNRAVDNRVPPEHMPKKLFVISDMQFDQACTQADNYVTNHEAIKQKYREAGYQLPQMVYWNVRGSRVEFPTTKDEIGVAMVSGFSPSILKQLIKCEKFSPYLVLRSIIDNPRYAILSL